jgi:hypothetical protein
MVSALFPATRVKFWVCHPIGKTSFEGDSRFEKADLPIKKWCWPAKE